MPSPVKSSLSRGGNDPFKELILQNIIQATKETPTTDALFNLLKIVNPGLHQNDVLVEGKQKT